MHTPGSSLRSPAEGEGHEGFPPPPEKDLEWGSQPMTSRGALGWLSGLCGLGKLLRKPAAEFPKGGGGKSKDESTLHIRWPKYRSFSFSISPSNEHPGLISFRMDWLDLFTKAPKDSQGLSRVAAGNPGFP